MRVRVIVGTLVALAVVVGGGVGDSNCAGQSGLRGRGAAPASPMMRPPAALSGEMLVGEMSPIGSARFAEELPPRRAAAVRSERSSTAHYNESPAIGTGVRASHRLAAYQSAGEGQPYYVPQGPGGERLPPAIGSPVMQGHEVYEEGWPGGGLDPSRPGIAGLGCDPACNTCCLPPPLLPRPQLGSVEVLAGVHGFTGSANRGSSASFGFHEGVQIGMPLFCQAAAEFGVLATQSNFEGSMVTADDRHQLFLTAGLFRRVDWGLQGGIAFDYLHDEWDYEIDLGQLRGELSWVLPCGHDVGFWFTAGVDEAHDTVNVVDVVTGGPIVVRETARDFAIDDLFAFFYRRQFACGGEGRLFGGFTSESEGLFGGDFRMPMNPCWSLDTDFIYVVPRDRSDLPGYAEEAWNLSIGVVWTPWSGNGCGKNYDRPLQGVANNGSFISKVR